MNFRSNTSKGIMLMVLSSACFTLNDTVITLAMRELPPFQALFFRGIGSLVLGVPLLAAMGLLKFMPKMIDGRVQLRNLLEISAAMSAVVALANVPIANVTSLQQTAPLMLLIGAAVFFREKLQRLQIVLIILAFAGALLVAQPGGSGFSPFMLFAVWCAVSIAARDLVGRRIDDAIPAVVIAVAAGLIEIVGAGVGGLLFEQWVVPSVLDFTLCFATAAFLIGAQWLIVLSYRAASVGTVAPFLYMTTVWSLFSGAIVFGHVPNNLALAGIVLIVVSGVAVVALERWPARLKPSPE